MQGWENLPTKFRPNVQSLHELNPTFEHLQWDEEGLRRECAKISPAVLKKFNSFQTMLQKVDLGRYVVLYNYGGVSVDTDMKSLKPIMATPNVRDHDFIVSSAAFPIGLAGWVNNALIMCRSQHPILHELIMSIAEDRRAAADFATKELLTSATTGPGKFNTILATHRSEIFVLDNAYFEPCFSVDPLCAPGPQSIMDHQHELSWFSDLTKWLCQILIIILYCTLYVGLPVTVIFLLYPYVKKGVRKLGKLS
jgi:mannosyltransferase OCH1-like enzyme